MLGFPQRELQGGLSVLKLANYLFRRIEKRRRKVNFNGCVRAQKIEPRAVRRTAEISFERQRVKTKLYGVIFRPAVRFQSGYSICL